MDYYQYSYNEQGAGAGHPGGEAKIARVGGDVVLCSAPSVPQPEKAPTRVSQVG